MNFPEAAQFIDFNIKQGVYDPEVFESMSNDELIAFAEKESARGDYYANLKEEE